MAAGSLLLLLLLSAGAAGAAGAGPQHGLSGPGGGEGEPGPPLPAPPLPAPPLPFEPEPPAARCEEIRITMCRGIGYNLTSMPNELNHETQEEAGLEVHQFFPLVQIGCSSDLRFFLCSVYMPICLETYEAPLPACRSVCERARRGCEPLMLDYGFVWPERMACERFPVYGDRRGPLCMDEGSRAADGSAVTPTPAPQPQPPPRATRRPAGGGGECRGKKCAGGGGGGGGVGGGRGRDQPAPPSPGGASEAQCTCRCKFPLVPVPFMGALGGAASGPGSVVFDATGVGNCSLPCRALYFSQEEREFASVWIALWSALCFASTLLTVTTFLIDPERFRYPERPIAFLSACYLLVAAGYLLRAVLGHETVACEGGMLRRGAAGPGLCTLVFLLVYYFGMASAVWWVVLALTWFLAAGLKWGNEAIAGYSQYFHLAAWLLPTLQTVAVLVAGAVDGDPVAGVCSVGNQSATHLRAFVLAPLLSCLLAGAAFLLAGFVALFRIRQEMRAQGGAGRCKADKLEKLMIRIGVFSVLYAVPAAALAACMLYESAELEAWVRSLACPCAPRSRPLYAAIMLKYFMALAVGITSGVWIWSGKTLESWRRLWRRLCGGGAGRGAAGAASAQVPADAKAFSAPCCAPAPAVVPPGATLLLPPPHVAAAVAAPAVAAPNAAPPLGAAPASLHSAHSAHTALTAHSHSHALALKPSHV